MENNAFEKAYHEAKTSDADILNFNFLPSTYWQYKTEANSDPIYYEGNCLEAIFDHEEFYTFVLCWSKLYKKELLKDIRFSNNEFYEDGNFAYKVLARAKKMKVIPDTLYEYNIENPESACGKISESDRLISIFRVIEETVNDWKQLNIFEKYKYQYIQHILKYISLVCPNVLEGDYSNELAKSFGFDILDESIINNVSDSTKALIRQITHTPKC